MTNQVQRDPSQPPDRRALQLPRAAGILLHPTALPGRYGIGDLGESAHRFVDLLRQSGQQFWQILPLGPAGLGNSPYAADSAFAGNPLLIGLDRLVAEGYLECDDLDGAPDFPEDRVDYAAVTEFKIPLLRRALTRFETGARRAQRAAFSTFVRQQRGWLDDYALFEALRTTYPDTPWIEWPSDLALRKTAALRRARRELAAEVRFQQFCQFLFVSQWRALRAAAHQAGVQIVGDLPIFLAHDSVDVWANQSLFELDQTGATTVVAGVPPDAFSATGQLWGNPLYRWEANAATGYAWWKARCRAVLELVDHVRIDHFRGFEACWQVPRGAETAESGQWVAGPRRSLFDALAQDLDNLPIIVEDLGLITPDVVKLRDELGYPGMKVLQFAFDSGPDNPYLPHNYHHHCVVYTGTHDNDTTSGWFAGQPTERRQAVLDYLGTPSDQIHWDLIRLALMSVADLAIVPLQDVLGLGSEARFNRPGQAEGNWEWRFRWDQVHPKNLEQLGHLTQIYGRTPRPL